MPITSPDGIAYADTSYAAGFAAAQALMASSIQAALDKRQLYSYVWLTSTAQNAQTGMSRGATGYRVDTSQIYIYNGATWVLLNTHGGRVPIIPVGVSGTGATLGVGGLITLTASTAWAIDGCFTTAFDNYIVEITGSTVTSLQIEANLRAASSNNSTGYDQTLSWAVTTVPASTSSTNQTAWLLAPANTATYADYTVNVRSPMRAQRTLVRSEYFGDTASNGTNQLVGIMGGTHRTADAFDGIRFTPAAALTGECRVYGLNNLS